MPRGRPRKVAKEVNIKQEKAQTSNPVIDACEQAKTRFKDVVIIGMNPNNTIDIIPSIPHYSHINHMINRALFELLIHEKNTIAASLQKPEAVDIDGTKAIHEAF